MTTETPTKELTVKKPEIVVTMQKLIEQYKPAMARLLGKHLDVEQMFQIALLAIGRNPKLAQCTGASVLGCVLESSRLRLQAGAGAGETWLVPFKNKYTGQLEAQLIVDYRGLIKLMKRGADVDSVLAEEVLENDAFDYGVKDGRQFLEWRPAKSNRGKAIGYVAATWNKSGTLTAVVYKTIVELDKSHRARSKAKDSGPWQTDPESMYRKTVLRLTAKLNPYSTEEVTRAVSLDERAELGRPQNLALLADPEAEASPEVEEAQPYQEPQRKAKEGDDFQEVQVEGVISGTSKNGPTWIIKGKGGKEFRTDSPELAEFALERAKNGKAFNVLAEKREGVSWIVETKEA